MRIEFGEQRARRVGAGLGARRVALRGPKCRAFGERRLLDEARVIVETDSLFPEIEAGLAPMRQRVVEIDAQERPRRLRRAVAEGVEREATHHGQRAQRGTVVLWPAPFQHVETAIGVVTRLTENLVAHDPRNLLARAHMLPK